MRDCSIWGDVQIATATTTTTTTITKFLSFWILNKWKISKVGGSLNSSSEKFHRSVETDCSIWGIATASSDNIKKNSVLNTDRFSKPDCKGTLKKLWLRRIPRLKDPKKARQESPLVISELKAFQASPAPRPVLESLPHSPLGRIRNNSPE